MAGVPSSTFDVSDRPPMARLADFASVTDTYYEATPIGAIEDFNVLSVGHSAGGLVFNQVQFSPIRFQRLERHLSKTGDDPLLLEALLTGEKRVHTPMVHYRMVPNRIYLRDWSTTFDEFATAKSLNSTIIPRRRLGIGSELGPANPVLSWSMSEPAGRTLSLLWAQLLGEFETCALEDAERLVDGFLGFLDAMAGQGDAENGTADLYTMQQFLESRLQNAVGIEDLCAHFKVSRATVFRKFEPMGGVKTYISNRRLDRSYAELAAADPVQTEVRDIARSLGFETASVFSRKFRDRFDVQPSRVLGQGRRLGSEAGAEHALDAAGLHENYRKWLQFAAGATRETHKLP